MIWGNDRRLFFVRLAAVAILLPLPLLGQGPASLLPYTITSVVGGGTVCSGAPDAIGDGCPAAQATLSTVLLGIAVGPQGDLYIEDTTNNVIRRVDPNTGLITVFAGSAKSTVCAAATDRYGDGCPASDGLANAAGGYTALGKPYGIAVAKNGDVYFTGGTAMVQKVSAATGMMSLVAGMTSPAGNKGAAVAGYTGDGGPANVAKISVARGLAVDAANDVFIADFTNNVIRVVYGGGATAAAQITASNPSVTTPVVGNIYTIVGSHAGTAGTTGDGGAASAALLSGPSDMAVDSYGNMYILDQSKEIRMVYAGGNVMGLASPVVGNIYRVAGGGSVQGKQLAPILGTTAAMSTVRRVITDPKGNLYIADSNELIWFVDAATGWMRPIVGVFKASGLPLGCPQQTDAIGNGCPATVAQIHVGVEGYGMAVDAGGNLYVSDASAETIRKVSTGAAFPATAAGSPVTQTVELHFPVGAVAPSSLTGFSNSNYSAGNLTCTTNGDATQDCVVPVTFAPTTPGVDNSVLALNASTKMGFTGVGVAPALGLDPGVAAAFGAGQKKPQAVVSDGSHLYIADTQNNRVLQYDIAAQTQTVLAGTGTAGYGGDGAAATAATLNRPQGVAVAADGTVYIADTGNNVVRRVDAVTGNMSTYAGGASVVCAEAADAMGDGCVPAQVKFSAPAGLAVDATGLLYVADTGNNRVRTVPLYQGGVQTVVGGASAVCSGATDAVGNGCNALQATLRAPSQLRFDASGNLYIADTGDNMVRRVNLTAAGQSIVALAGNGQAGGSGDGGAATSAQLNASAGIAVDAAGDVYIADTGNDAVRMVAASSGVISTVAGINGTSGVGTLPGTATASLLARPMGVEVVGAGSLYVTDTGNSRSLTVDRDSLAIDFGKVNLSDSSPVQTVTVMNTGATATSLGTPLVRASGASSEFSFVAATTNGCSAAEALAVGAQCVMSAQYTPTLTGNHAATYSFAGSTGVNAPVPAVILSGGGALLIATTTAAAVTTPSGRSPQYGETTVVTVTVSPASQGPSAISGSVVLQIDGTAQAPVAVAADSSGNGVTKVTLPKLSVGDHAIVASYKGDPMYAASTANSLTVSVGKATASVSLSALPTATVQFQSVTFTAKVAATTGDVPTGSVNFMNGTTLLGTGTVGTTGVATLTTTTLAVANYNVVAQYSGDGNFLQAGSTGVAFVVSPDPQDFSISVSSSSMTVATGGIAQTTVTITPTNTLNGDVKLSCGGMPAYAVCTFLPAIVSFTPATDQPTQVVVSLWTNISPGTTPTASVRTGNAMVFFGLLCPVGLLALSRRRLGGAMRVLGICCVLIGAAGAMAGCGNGQTPEKVVTPAGKSTVTLTASGPTTQVHTLPVTFTVVQ